MAVNCSDLAAMGGTPRAAVAGVLVPEGRPGLADAVAAGLMDAAVALGCPLVGGDTAVGASLVLSVAVLGDAPTEGPILRSGARTGDTVFVTGPLGGARAAIAALRRGEKPDPAAAARLHRPVPRMAEGRAAVVGGASAMIDLSDGLSSDLAHICRASGAGVRLEEIAIPYGSGARLDDALAGGDDYELCFTAPDPSRVTDAFASAGLPAPIRIGTVVAEVGLTIVGPDGESQPLPPRGWEHPVP